MTKEMAEGGHGLDDFRPQLVAFNKEEAHEADHKEHPGLFRPKHDHDPEGEPQSWRGLFTR